MKWQLDGSTYIAYFQNGFDYEIRVYGDSARLCEWPAGTGGSACRTMEFRGADCVEQAKERATLWSDQRKAEK